MADLLRVEGLCAGYGAARVVNNVSFAFKWRVNITFDSLPPESLHSCAGLKRYAWISDRFSGVGEPTA